MRVWRCLVDAETRNLVRAANDVLQLAEVRALLEARDFLDGLVTQAIEAAWDAGCSRIALARLVGVDRSVLYKRMAVRP